MHTLARLVAVLLGVGCACAEVLPADAAQPQGSKPEYQVKVERNTWIPMRDGVRLAAHVYRPDAAGKFPALMTLVYYPTGEGDAAFFARYGYACVVVNSRGRGGSEGQWDPYVNDPRDGYDAQQWIGVQPWCDGKIGMYGQSYNAFTQFMTASMASPYLKCILPLEGQQTNFGHLYNDGVLQLNVVFTFGLFATGPTQTGPHIPIGPHYLQLPLMSAADKVDNPQAQRIKTWMCHARYDDYWKSYGIKEKYAQIQVPALIATGWYDNLVHEGFRNFRGFREQGGSDSARKGTKIRVGPGTHGSAGVTREMHLRWYDYWLKGIDTGIDREPPIAIYVMGADQWRTENEWPLARTKFTKYYLQSGGKANSIKGDGRLITEAPPADAPPDRFVYDPQDPVYTLGGQMSTHVDIWGPKDRSTRQERGDVLVYTTEPLADDVELTGPIDLRLFAASSAVDTDFTATLTDVYPDGRAIHICEGIRGVTFRESLENPTPIEPGKIYEYTISLWETSNVFKAGHRIRLEVSSSNFPRYARNQNTGLPLGTSAELKKAEQTIYHDAAHASHLVLPVIPAASGSQALRGNPAATTPRSVETPWRVGLASAKITPQGPVPMCGYGPRMSTGVLDDLWAKVMAIEHAGGGKAVLVTADLIFYRAALAESLTKRIMERTGLKREQILLTASHTHAGPMIEVHDMDVHGAPTPQQVAAVGAYVEKLQSDLVDLAAAALADMKPARLSWGAGQAGDFIANRRVLNAQGKYAGMAPNPKGVVDRSVPVLRVDTPERQMRAVVFGCACHNVTLDGANLKISADYAGYAQQYIQKHHPGALAMFVIGCGADANTNPRGGPNQEQLVRKHGETLGSEVCRVLAGKFEPIDGPLRPALEWVDLPLAQFSRDELSSLAKSGSFWHARSARGILQMLDRNQPAPKTYRAPLAMWQFGDSLTLVGLPGEAVADYVSLVQEVLKGKRVWVAGYCNESFGYLPTAKQLEEGGHETIGLTLDIGLFAPEVQATVVAAVRQMATVPKVVQP